MVVANKLVGVLDVQDDHLDRFSDEDVRVQVALANQVAVAVENGRAFLESQKTADRLREVDKLKSQFLANMSHELRTPLNSIIGYAEVLLDGIDGDLNDEATEDVEAIHGGGKHLLTIINDILDLAKIEAGQMFIEPRETNLTPVIEDVINTCDILARNKGLQLLVSQQSEIPTIKGDTIRLKQIILNLVNNAIKFTDSGSITIDMSLDTPHMVKVRVIDTGMGMNEDELKGLFQQFHQVDGSPTRRAGGTGLGLVITRHLVTMHGGVVSVESKKGEGTVFWFTVPVWAHSTQSMRRVSSTAVN
jgi:signal transduction histidine kinase